MREKETKMKNQRKKLIKYEKELSYLDKTEFVLEITRKLKKQNKTKQNKTINE